MLLGFWGRVTSGALSGESDEFFLDILAKISVVTIVTSADGDFSATKYCQAFSQTSKESLSCL